MTTTISATTAKRTARKRPGLEEQRTIILGAAVELFSLHGGKAVSVSDICRKAQVSRDTYYRCFADKEALISQLYQTSVNDHIERVLGSWDLDYNNQEWLEQACDDTIDAILQQHQVARFLFVESADPNSPAWHVIHNAYTNAARRMQQWCEKHQVTVPPREFLIALLVATQWLVHDAISRGMSPRRVNKAKLVTRQLFQAAFSSLKE